MGAQIIPFDFETKAVRVVMIEDAPVFIASDACRGLEIDNHRDAIAGLDDDERVSVLVDTLGGQQTMTAVTESGLYALIMTSRKPAAKRFRKWVTAEVLPAIRRDGFYGIGSEDRADLAAKRAHHAALPEAARAKAAVKVAALQQIAALLNEGERLTRAVKAAAEASRCCERSVWSYYNTVYMANGSDRASWGEVAVPQEGDAVLMAQGALPCHVGVWLDLGGVLHAVTGAGGVFTPLGRLRDMGYRVVGYYRRVA